MGPKASPVPLVLLDVDIGNTTPDTQHRDIRFAVIEGLPRGHSRKEGSKGFTPEGQRKASLVKHRDNILLHGPVGTLRVWENERPTLGEQLLEVTPQYAC